MNGASTELYLTSSLNKVLLPSRRTSIPVNSLEEGLVMTSDGKKQVSQSNHREAMPFEKTVRSWVHSNRQRSDSGSAEPDAEIERVTVEFSSPIQTQNLDLRPGQKTSFGRKSAADQCIDSDRCMSNVHFSIECNLRSVVLIDQGSTNGTFVNGHRVQRLNLRDGDQVIAGTTIFMVRIGYSSKSVSAKSEIH